LAAAQDAPPRETLDDAPAAPRPRLVAPPSNPVSPAGFASIQVNIDADGNDILNDAANEPSIAIDPTAPNRMVVGWRQFDDVQSNFRQAGYSWTNDGGRSWHFDGVLEPGTFGSDPSLESDSQGNFYYMTLHGGFDCYLFKSKDGGRTWGGGVYAVGGDKEWITIDKTGGIGDGNIYQAWTNETGNRSTDGGASFGDIVNYRAGHWGTLAVGPDGELYAASDFEASRSDNARDPNIADFTFSVASFNLGGGFVYGGAPNPGGILGPAWIDVDRSEGPTRGYVYIAASVDDNTGRSDVRFVRSTDGGKNWSQFIDPTGEPDNATAWQWFGTMSVAPNGRIDLVWNDTVTDQDTLSELRYSYSLDQGHTWAPPQTMGPQWNSHIGWPNQQKIGDYYDMQSDLVGANLAYAATYTGGQDVYYLRIGEYDCNGNGVGDTEDIAGGIAADCNSNGIPDSCEIAAGAEADAEHDGIPDSCQICYADFNRDGLLDLFDFLAFVNLFNTADPKADCDNNGGHDLFDFLCFVNAFNAGC